MISKRDKMASKYCVLIVDTAIDFGGSIVSTANLIRGLDRDRFEPVFVSSSSEELVRNRLAEVSDRTNVVILKKPMHYARMMTFVWYAKKLKPRFLRRGLILGAYLVRLFVNIPYTIRLARLIKKHKVDLVQLNNGFGNDELDFVCLLMSRSRVVFFRGYAPLSAIERKFFLDGVKGFVSVSEFVKKEAVADGVPAEKVLVATPPAIPEPFDESLRRSVRERYGIADSAPVFGIFGRIVRWKGQKEFIRAAAIVMRDIPTAKAVIVGDVSDGDATYSEEVRELVNELGIAANVVFTGYIDKVHELYCIMDVVAHTSVEPEPSGRVIFESMSYGIPIIASCYGGPKEFIENGVDGFICDPSNSGELAQRIVEMLTDEDRRAEIGARAQQKVASRHNKRAYASQIERVYLKSLGVAD